MITPPPIHLVLSCQPPTLTKRPGPARGEIDTGAADTLGVDRGGGGRRKVDARREGIFTRNFNVGVRCVGGEEGRTWDVVAGCFSFLEENRVRLNFKPNSLAGSEEPLRRPALELGILYLWPPLCCATRCCSVPSSSLPPPPPPPPPRSSPEYKTSNTILLFVFFWMCPHLFHVYARMW